MTPRWSSNHRWPDQELPRHRLAADHVGVGLDPHPADRHEPAGLDVLLHPLEQRRVVLAHPVPLLRRRHRVDEVVPVVQEVHHVGDGAGHLAHGLADRPQPGRVDVGVPDRGDPVGAVVRRPAERPGQRGRGRRCGARHVGEVERVERRLEREQDLHLPGVVVARARRPAGRAPRGRPAARAPRVVDVDDRRGCEPVDGVGRRRSACRRAAVGLPAVEHDAGWRRPRRTARPARPGPTGTQSLSGFSALDVGAVGPVARAPRTGSRRSCLPNPRSTTSSGCVSVGRHLAGEPEPGRRPGRDPTGRRPRTRRTSWAWPHRERHRLAHRPVGFGRYVPRLHPAGRRAPPRGGSHVLVDDPPQPAPDLAASVVHVPTLSSRARPPTPAHPRVGRGRRSDGAGRSHLTLHARGGPDDASVVQHGLRGLGCELLCPGRPHLRGERLADLP